MTSARDAGSGSGASAASDKEGTKAYFTLRDDEPSAETATAEALPAEVTSGAGRSARDVLSDTASALAEESVVGGREDILRAAEQEEALRTSSERQLLAEIERRVLREWEVLTSDSLPAEDLSLEFDTLRLLAARRVLALRFLHEGTELESEPGPRLRQAVDQALVLAQEAGKEPPTRLLAAAFLAHRGDRTGAELVETALTTPEARAASAAPLPAASHGASGGFRIATLSFARSIRGPGDYTARPASQVGPGVLVLVYGEFHGFATEEPPPVRGRARAPAAAPECAFEAALKLIDGAGATLDRLDFLPAGRGRQAVAGTGEFVNFWAQYRIPEKLPIGVYTVRIEARDLIGDASTSGELEFRVSE